MYGKIHNIDCILFYTNQYKAPPCHVCSDNWNSCISIYMSCKYEFVESIFMKGKSIFHMCLHYGGKSDQR